MLGPYFLRLFFVVNSFCKHRKKEARCNATTASIDAEGGGKCADDRTELGGKASIFTDFVRP